MPGKVNKDIPKIKEIFRTKQTNKKIKTKTEEKKKALDFNLVTTVFSSAFLWGTDSLVTREENWLEKYCCPVSSSLIFK